MKVDLRRSGCVYVAYGYEYLMLAAHSATTLKKHTPDLAITLVTNIPIQTIFHEGTPLFEKIIYKDDEQKTNRLSKLAVDLYSPYEKTLYLDCDTEIWADVSPMFGLLEMYEFAARAFSDGTRQWIEVFDGVKATELGLSMWNGGVLFFRKSHQTNELFGRWRDNYQSMGFGTDQPALMKAIYGMPQLRLLILSSFWNAHPNEFDLIERQRDCVRIFHYREPAARPDVAKRIWCTYRNLNVDFDLSRCNDARRATGIERERVRFATLYSWYILLLKPFDSRRGRRWLFSHRKRSVERFLRAFFELRGRLLGDAPIKPYRDHKRAGRSAKKSLKPALRSAKK
jgi:hypothetical protein